MDVTVRDADGRVVLEETHVRFGGAWERVTWTVRTYDDFGHVLNVYRSDNTVTEAVWGCCGQTSYTDETGIQTLFEPPDALGRISDTTKVGTVSQLDIHTHYDFDVMGRIEHTLVSSGGLSLESSATYDWAGRALSSTDEAGLTTSYQYCLTPICTTDPNPPGCRRTEVTFPGGATQITENYLDGRVRCVTGSAVIARHYQYGVDDIEIEPGVTISTTWKKVMMGYETSPRYEQTWYDMLGREVRQEKPGFWGVAGQEAKIRTSRFYDSAGRLLRIASNVFSPDGQSISGGGGGIDPGCIDCPPSGGGSGTATGGAWISYGADVWYVYDDTSNVFQTGSDLDGNAGLQVGGSDRITETVTSYVFDSGKWWSESSTFVYPTIGSAAKLLSAKQRHQLTGLVATVTRNSESTDGEGMVTQATTTINRTTKTVVETTNLPLSTLDAVNVSVNGLVQSSTSGNGITYTYLYDELGRRTTVIDPRTGSTTTHYDPLTGRVDYVEDAAGKRTTYDYEPLTGRLASVTNPATKKTYYAYNYRNQATRVWGDVPQPVETVYDPTYGQRTALRTFRGGTEWNGSSWPTNTGAADETSWNFDEATGLITKKTYADGKFTEYKYTIGGALYERIWARPCMTCAGQVLKSTYDYYPLSGEIKTINYSDTSPATPDVEYSYDRLGRRKLVTQKDGAGAPIMTHDYAYYGLAP